MPPTPVIHAGVRGAVVRAWWAAHDGPDFLTVLLVGQSSFPLGKRLPLGKAPAMGFASEPPKP